MALATRFTKHTFIGRILRLPLRVLPRSSVVRVLRGPMHGFRWVVGSANHGCWLGTYEREMQELVVASLKRGDVFYDIGANVGSYSLLGSRCVGPEGAVVAFEPAQTNLAALRLHLEINGVSNATVIAAAVGDHSGEARFSSGPSHLMGRLDETGDIAVKLVCIDDLVAARAIPEPTAMKVDVEGAAGAVFAGAARTIARRRPVIFLAIHDSAERAACWEALEHHGYTMTAIDSAGDNWKCAPQ